MTVNKRDAVSESFVIPLADVELRGDLAMPEGAAGLVLLTHESGNSRGSSRSRFIGRTLRQRGLGTLLCDLLTEEEERRDAIEAQLRFNIPLLAARLSEVTAWIRARAESQGQPVGYFAASAGVAAALTAAADHQDAVHAVVAIGGRPDLAEDALERVLAPTLLVVGGADPAILEVNQKALARLRGEKQLDIVPGATHLFEEPGALEAVARLSADWLAEYLQSEARGDAREPLRAPSGPASPPESASR